jgi:predicted hydrolase (HD superfamily)
MAIVAVMTTTSLAGTRPSRRDPTLPILQARDMDPEVYRAMRIECASKGVKLATLIEAMWLAYSEKTGQIAAVAS